VSKVASEMAVAADYSAVETSRDGRRLEIRALRPNDRDEFAAAASSLSAESLYRRFFAAKRHFSEEERSFFVDLDFINHVALVALLEDRGGGDRQSSAAHAMSSPSLKRRRSLSLSSINIRG
jgi:hypothetical protein